MCTGEHVGNGFKHGIGMDGMTLSICVCGTASCKSDITLSANDAKWLVSFLEDRCAPDGHCDDPVGVKHALLFVFADDDYMERFEDTMHSHAGQVTYPRAQLGVYSAMTKPPPPGEWPGYIDEDPNRFIKVDGVCLKTKIEFICHYITHGRQFIVGLPAPMSGQPSPGMVWWGPAVLERLVTMLASSLDVHSIPVELLEFESDELKEVGVDDALLTPNLDWQRVCYDGTDVLSATAGCLFNILCGVGTSSNRSSLVADDIALSATMGLPLSNISGTRIHGIASEDCVQLPVDSQVTFRGSHVRKFSGAHTVLNIELLGSTWVKSDTRRVIGDLIESIWPGTSEYKIQNRLDWQCSLTRCDGLEITPAPGSTGGRALCELTSLCINHCTKTCIARFRVQGAEWFRSFV